MENTDTGVEQDVQTGKTGVADNQQADQGIGGVAETVDTIASGDDGKDGAWRVQLPSDIRDAECFKPYKRQKDLYRAFYEMSQRQGTNHDDAPDAEREPDEGYKAFYDSVRDQDEHSRKRAGMLLDMFRKGGIPSKEVKEFLDAFQNEGVELVKDRARRMREECDKGVAKLWGDDAEANGRYLEYAKTKLLTKEQVESLERSGALLDVQVLDILARYGKAMGESAPAGGDALPKEKDIVERFFGSD